MLVFGPQKQSLTGNEHDESVERLHTNLYLNSTASMSKTYFDSMKTSLNYAVVTVGPLKQWSALTYCGPAGAMAHLV